MRAKHRAGNETTLNTATDRVGRHHTTPEGALQPALATIALQRLEISQLQRRLEVVLKSNARMREQVAELRPQFERKIRTEKVRRRQEHERAELWRHRAMRRVTP